MDKSTQKGIVQKVRGGLTGVFDSRSSALLVIGLALFYAWNLSAIYGEPIIFTASTTDALRVSTVVSSACNTASYIAIALIFWRLRRFAKIAGSASYVAGVTLLVGYALSSLPGFDTQIVRLVVTGIDRICAAWVIVAWGMRYARLDSLRITIYTLAAFLIAFAICPLLVHGSPLIRALLTAVLLPVSMGLMKASENYCPETVELKPVPHSFATMTWRIVVIFFLFGIVAWVAILGTQSRATEGALFTSIVTGGSAAVVAALFVLAVTMEGAFSQPYIYKVVFPLVMTGTLLIAAFNMQSTLGSSLISIGYTCFDLFCFAIFADTCRKTGADPKRAFGWCRAIESSAPLFALAAIWISETQLGIGDRLIFYVFEAASVAVVLVAITLDRTGIFEKSHLDPRIDYPRVEVLYFARQCEVVIERKGLTPREAEVLGLVVRGRSVPHIAERLMISRSTVKTHITHIYQKLGVGDRQEMIDAIESMPVE